MSREFRPCGHSALGCYNGAGACCKDCDHPTYWRLLDMGSEATRRPIQTVELPIAEATS